jgi:hypothetical protein
MARKTAKNICFTVLQTSSTCTCTILYCYFCPFAKILFNSLQEAQAYAEENSLLFMETSAKTAMNVNDIFLAIGKFVLCFLALDAHMFSCACSKEASKE